MSRWMSFCLAVLLLLALSSTSVFAEPQSAKDMFFDQLDSPDEKLNTGFKYWIQLRRGGKVSLVDNRITFHSGDQIRFQIIPNITGYAYVVLVKGSTGRQQVLFPNSIEPNGKVTAGKQVSLPISGFLMFDKNPGLETIRIVISRTRVDESALLDSTSDNHIDIAYSSSSAEPIQGKNCLAAFSQAENNNVEFAAKPAEFSKDLVYVPGTRPVKRHLSSRIRRPAHKKRKATGTRVSGAHRPGSVTVINIEPAENLGADITLNHAS